MSGRYYNYFIVNQYSTSVSSRSNQPVSKWSLPDNSHVCLVTNSTSNREHFSRDIAVSNLTAMIARDEYVLEESYSGEEDDEEVKEREDEGKDSDSETDSEIGRLRERKEELEKARQKEQARARKSQEEILTGWSVSAFT